MTGPVAFGYKMAWVAVRAEPDRVIKALGIEGVEESIWADGIERVYGEAEAREAFVTPALDGWTLVVSAGLFDELSDADPGRLVTFVTDLARRLGTEVQLFGTHRVVEGHAWARADTEGLQRAYYYLGEVGECLLDKGAPTPVEGSVDLDPPGEDSVMEVARAWSLDPTRVEEDHPDVGEGWLGRLDSPESTMPDDGAASEGVPRPWWRFW